MSYIRNINGIFKGGTVFQSVTNSFLTPAFKRNNGVRLLTNIIQCLRI